MCYFCKHFVTIIFDNQISYVMQGLHRLEKYVNSEGYFEKSFKIKYASKSAGNHLKALKSA